MAQVKMPSWSKGRIALIGDAAYCPSPYTAGQGTSLSLVGAYTFAFELARGADHPSAFAAYEDRMRPFVDINQAIAELSRDPRFGSDPRYYIDVIEPAMARAENAITLEWHD